MTDLTTTAAAMGALAAELEAAHYTDKAIDQTVYVDAANGDDTNDGEPDAPLQTLDAAIARLVAFGRTRITLAADQTYSLTSRNELIFQAITLAGGDGAESEASYPVIEVASLADDVSAGFDCRPAFINLEKLIIEMPEPVSGASAGDGPETGLFEAIEGLGRVWLSATNIVFRLRETPVIRSAPGGWAAAGLSACQIENHAQINHATLLQIDDGLASLTGEALSGAAAALAVNLRGGLTAADGEYTNLLTNLTA